MFTDPTRHPPPLYLLHGDDGLRRRLRDVGGRVVELADWGALLERVRAGEEGAVAVVDPYLGGGAGLAPALRTLRLEFPSAVVVAALHLELSRVADIRTLGEWGVAEVVTLQLDETPFRLSRRIAAARERSAVHAVMEALPPGMPPRTRTLVQAALAALARGGGPAEMGHALFVSGRTLQRRVARAGLPAPRQLLGWARLLVAARYLDDPGRTIHSAARAAGYSSDTSLHRALRRFGLPAAGELRERGARAGAAAAFLAACRR